MCQFPAGQGHDLAQRGQPHVGESLHNLVCNPQAVERDGWQRTGCSACQCQCCQWCCRCTYLCGVPQLFADIRHLGAERLDIAKQIQTAACFQHDGIRCFEADIGAEAIEYFAQKGQPCLFMLTILRKMPQRVWRQALCSGQRNTWADTQGQCCSITGDDSLVMYQYFWTCSSGLVSSGLVVLIG